MDFSLDIWKETLPQMIDQLGSWLALRKMEELPYLVYRVLCRLSLWPVIQATQKGSIFPALMTLGQVVRGPGGMLLAQQLQHWRDSANPASEDGVETWVAATIVTEAHLRETLDMLLIEFEVIPQAYLHLAGTDRIWFSQQLRQELNQLGSLERFSTTFNRLAALSQTGTTPPQVPIPQPPVIPQSASGQHIAASNVASGAQSRVVTVESGSYVEQHFSLPASSAETVLSQLRTRYLHSLIHHCNILPLAALGGDPETDDTVNLQDVYIALNTQSHRENSTTPDYLATPLSALEAVTQAPRVVLLGQPGSGKSTFVQQLAAWLAAAQLQKQPPPSGWEDEYWPLMMPLRELAARLADYDFTQLSTREQQQCYHRAVKEQWCATFALLGVADLEEHLDTILAQQPILFIFDGVDEVAAAMRSWVHQAVRAAINLASGSARVIITCRTRSYTGTAQFPGFVQHILASFSQTQSDDFITAWYQARQKLGQLTPDQAQTKCADLQRAAHSPTLCELAGNPMLLTTMAIIHQREVGLPRERVRLYDLAVKILLNLWQRHKGEIASPALQAVLNDQLKIRQLLEHLAYAVHQRQAQEGQEADLARSDILVLLESPKYLNNLALAGEFLDYVDQRAGLLVGQGGHETDQRPQTYRFPHRTFQEYLAGCHIIAGRKSGLSHAYWRRVREGDYWVLAAQLGAEELLYNQRSEEDFLDLAYALSPASEPTEPTQWRAVLWSGQMARLVASEIILHDTVHPEGGTTYLRRLIPRLAQIATGDLLSPIERVDAGRLLNHFGDPRQTVVPRSNATCVPLDLCYIPAGPFWLGSPTQDELAFSNEKPAQQANVPYDYWLSRYPITNAQFRCFVKMGGYQTPRYWQMAKAHGYWQAGRVKRISYIETGGEFKPLLEWATQPHDYGHPFSLSNHPVVGVTWYEATAFCLWLTERLQAAGYLPSGWQLALPSELEWAKAARGGLEVPAQPTIATLGDIDLALRPDILLRLRRRNEAQRRYPWGNTLLPNHLNYTGTKIGATSPVGCFPASASPYGCEEMSGTIWEWCRTRWQRSYARYQDDPSPHQTRHRTIRGGSFNDQAQSVRCAVRHGNAPKACSVSLGFRVVVRVGM